MIFRVVCFVKFAQQVLTRTDQTKNNGFIYIYIYIHTHTHTCMYILLESVLSNIHRYVKYSNGKILFAVYLST